MSISWENAIIGKNETQEFSANPIINKKVKIAVSGLQRTTQKYFITDIINEKDQELAADFIIFCVKQDNVKPKTRRVYVIALAYLCRYLTNKKYKVSLDKVTADMLYDYIDSFRSALDEKATVAAEAKKEEAAVDEEEARLLQQLNYQSWMTNQKTLCEPLKKFYKWVAYPQLTAQQRKRLPRDKWPDVLKRFELAIKDTGAPMTPVKDSDIWEEKDIAIFLKYCTDNRYSRLRLFHVMAWETSARPSELLQLRIADIEDNLQQEGNGNPCAVFEVGRNGKNKYAHRRLGITKLSLQYYNWYLHSHPDPKNRKAYLFASLEHSALGRNLPISEGVLQKEYTAFKDKVIPQLLKRSDVPEEDKKRLRFLVEVRKWYPYIVRHSSLTKLANDPNVNEYALRKHAGWSKTSRMIEIYTHRRESVESVMLAYGVSLKNSKKKQNQELRQTMTGPVCPFCAASNIPGTQLCVHCHKPIASNAMDAVMKESENQKKELEEMKAKMTVLQANTSQLIEVIAGTRENVALHAWSDRDELMLTAKKIEEESAKRKEIREKEEARRLQRKNENP
jgi:integrase